MAQLGTETSTIFTLMSNDGMLMLESSLVATFPITYSRYALTALPSAIHVGMSHDSVTACILTPPEGSESPSSTGACMASAMDCNQDRSSYDRSLIADEKLRIVNRICHCLTTSSGAAQYYINDLPAWRSMLAKCCSRILAEQLEAVQTRPDTKHGTNEQKRS